MELTHAPGNFAEKHSLRLVEPFSNQAKLLETLFTSHVLLFTSHVLCCLLFPITDSVLKILGGYAEGKILSFCV